MGRPPKGRGEQAARRRAAQEAQQELNRSPERRISFDRQLLPQAPATAIGYRLVGFAEDDGSTIVFPQNQPYWQLAPFQSPDYIGLSPGQYRVVWVDADAAQIPPENTGTVPVLDFFVGPADSTGLSAEEAAALIRAVGHFRSETLRQQQQITQLAKKVTEFRAKMRKDREFKRYKRSLRKADGPPAQEKDPSSQGVSASLLALMGIRLVKHFWPVFRAGYQKATNAAEGAQNAADLASAHPESRTTKESPVSAKAEDTQRRERNGTDPSEPRPPIVQSESEAEQRLTSDATSDQDASLLAPEPKSPPASENRVLVRLGESIRQVLRARNESRSPIEESLFLNLGEDGRRRFLRNLLVRNSGIPRVNKNHPASVQTLWRAHAALASTLAVAQFQLAKMQTGEQEVTVTVAAQYLVAWAESTLPILSRLRKTKTQNDWAFGEGGHLALSHLKPILQLEVPARDSIAGFLHDSLTIVGALLSKALGLERQELRADAIARDLNNAEFNPQEEGANLRNLDRGADQIQKQVGSHPVPTGAERDLFSGREIVSGAVPVQFARSSSEAEQMVNSGDRDTLWTGIPGNAPAGEILWWKIVASTPPRRSLEKGLSTVVSYLQRSLRAAEVDAHLLTDPFAQSCLQGWSAIRDKGEAMLDAVRERCGTHAMTEPETMELLLNDVLPVLDDVYRGVRVNWTRTPPHIAQKLRSLFEPVLILLLSVLHEEGLEPFEPLGQPFDKNEHEAVQVIEDPQQAAGIITSVVRVGIRRGAQLVRPPRVVVTGHAAA